MFRAAGVVTLAAFLSASAPAAPRQWYREGRGPTIVMLGGGTFGAAMFAPHAHELASEFDVIRVETLNVEAARSGASMPPDYSIAGEAEALRQTLAAIGVDGPVDLVGSSYGAAVALRFAVAHPDRVRSLTMFEPPAFWILSDSDYAADASLRDMRDLMTRMKGSVIPSDQDLVRFRCILGSCPAAIPLLSDPARAEWDIARLALRGLATTFESREDLARMRAFSRPVLLLGGTNTIPFHRRINELLAQQLPTAQTARVEGGHLAPSTNRSAFLATLRAFLAQQPVERVLQLQTQELMDALAPGTASVWQRLLDDTAIVSDENGTVQTKAELIRDFRPLPAGVSGTIALKDFRTVVHGNVAITNYVIDENENYHGQTLHSQYRSTDTWLQRGSEWRLIASQVLAMRADPPAIATDNSLAAEYIGRYALTPAITYEIRLNGDQLEGRRGDGAWEPLKVEAPDVLFVPGKPRYRKIMQRDALHKITGFAERREAWDVIWKRMP